MNEWQDLHGEDGDIIPYRPSKNSRWCDNCQCWVEYSDMKRWSNDDETISFLCNGCDYEFTELRESGEDRDEYHESQYMELSAEDLQAQNIEEDDNEARAEEMKYYTG